MLTELEISGLALINELSVSFSPGFNVITGETGAGKSILIKSLNLLLGARAEPELVRQGKSAGIVSASFKVEPGHPILERLAQLGIPVEEVVCLRRSIHITSGSKAWVNDVGVTITTLKEVARLLIDIFSQHENQRLLDIHTHMTFIDRLGEYESSLEGVLVAFEDVRRCVENLKSLLGSSRSVEDAEYVKFRLENFEKCAPNELEYSSLLESVKNQEALVKDREAVALCLSKIEEGGLTYLRDLGKSLSKIPGNLAGDAVVANETLIHFLQILQGALLPDSEMDSQSDLEEKQARLFKYQELIRKSPAKSIGSVVEEWERLKKEWQLIQNFGVSVGEELTVLEKTLAQWKKIAKELTLKRKQSAELIVKAIANELDDLSMKGARLEVSFVPVSTGCWVEGMEGVLEFDNQGRWEKLRNELIGVGRLGAEKAEFLLSANPGEKALPLEKIASGGELSRIMLAVKKILMSNAGTCVMVFDEIDTGISGRVADTVGQKIAELSRHHQVLCISHLPQVSVYADAHFQVKKSTHRRTESSIERLSPSEVRKEVARMLSAEEVSKSSLENAEALMKRARQKVSQALNNPKVLR